MTSDTSRFEERWRTVAMGLLVGGLAALGGWLWARSLSLGPIDDAFISLRYAANWATGKGLVFNPGERVEGFSNFLLVVLEAFLIRLGADGPRIMEIIGWLSLGLLAAVGYAFAVTYVLPGRRLPSAAVALAASTNVLTVSWAASGLETCLYAALVMASVHLALRGPGRGIPIAAAGVLFLAALTRWEALALAPVLGLVVGRAGTRREGAHFAVTFVALFGAYFVLRWAHFSQPLPNTFYAKLDYGGIALAVRGARYVWGFAVAAAPLVIPAVGALAFWRGAPRWVRATVAVVVVQVAVVVYEGGDHFALFRFVVPVLSCLSMLAVFALSRLGARLGSGPGHRVGVLVSIGVLVGWGHWAGQAPHRGDEQQRTEVARFHQEVRSAREWSALGHWFREAAPARASLATIAVGAIGYYSGMVIVDPHGIVDPVVAHREAALGTGYAGHEKYDIDYVLSRRPDYVLVLNYVTGAPVAAGEMAPLVWGDFNREILGDFRFLNAYRLEAIRLTGRATLNLHVRVDAPAPGQGVSIF